MPTPRPHKPRSMPAPLSQIRVLELSRILAGPWAGQTLADLGVWGIWELSETGFPKRTTDPGICRAALI